MNLRERNALIWMISMTGIGVILLLDIILLPPAVQRYNQLWNMRSQVAGKSTEEYQAARIASNVQEEAMAFKQQVERIERDIEMSHFESKGEADIPVFIESIQKLFSGPGLKLQQIAYQSKIRENGFVTFPFDSSVEASYGGLRNLIENILAHPAAIHIDSLEFLRLDNDSHLIHVKIRCSARFRIRA